MSHLLKEYENNLGVIADKPVINSHYFPILFDDYILIYNDGSTNPNFYHHYDLVLSLLEPYLNKNKKKVVFIGDKNGMPGAAEVSLTDLTFRQYCYLISKASVFVSNSNSLTQYASSVGTPLVNLFADNYPKVCKGFWSKQNHDCINIQANWEMKPNLISGVMHECINTIPAEKIVNGIIALTSNFKEKNIKFKTKLTNKESVLKLDLVGPFKNHEILNSAEIVNVRLDLSERSGSMEGLFDILKSKKCHVYVRNSVVDYNLIYSFHKNIEKIFILIDKKPPKIEESYFENINRLGVEVEFIVENESILEEVRFDYFEQNVSFKKEGNKKPKNIKKGDEFVTCRFVLADGKIYSSMSHWEKGLDNNNNILDNDLYWEELDYFYIYEQENN
jgi:ADP-heptose:LPS heptosyltransferase